MNQYQIDRKVGIILAGAASSSLFISVPANAQQTATSGITEVGDTVDELAGIAGAAATVVIVAMGVRLAIKQINRVMTKG